MILYVYRCPACPARVSLAGHMGFHVPTSCMMHPEPVAMERLPDTAQAILAMDPPRTGTIGPAKVETLRAVGILTPATQHALDWMWRNRKDNGMADAFLMVGGRRCIDLVAFAKLMREQRA